ncbi:hypothetical protein [Bradyrhizobium monzae]|uniref:hypothetical protein n=1 Tax=Bradyrhizobium sp. Oc8 TaxID=2876780 RepID=UPI001F20E031|nr:hypothetical protein [Bradyrhizobium sp. Oc8]
MTIPGPIAPGSEPDPDRCERAFDALAVGQEDERPEVKRHARLQKGRDYGCQDGAAISVANNAQPLMRDGTVALAAWRCGADLPRAMCSSILARRSGEYGAVRCIQAGGVVTAGGAPDGPCAVDLRCSMGRSWSFKT